MANDESKRSGRIAQIRSVYRMAKKSDPRIGLIVLGVLLAVFALFLVIGFVIGHPILLGIFGFLVGFLLAPSCSADGRSAPPSPRWRARRAQQWRCSMRCGGAGR